MLPSSLLLSSLTSDLWSLSSSVNKDLECRPLDDSLASIQSLQAVSACAPQLEAQPPPGQQTPDEDSENLDSQASCSFLPGFSTLVRLNGVSLVLPQQASSSDGKAPAVERPPYSYMALIQFAINSHRNRRMTLREIYTWIEDRFPYFRQAAKPGWKVPGADWPASPGNRPRKLTRLFPFVLAEFHSPQPVAPRHVHPRDHVGRQNLLLDHPARSQPLHHPGPGLQGEQPAVRRS